MQIRHAALCDYVSVDGSGKMSMCGIFDVVLAPRFPVLHPQCYFAGSLEVGPDRVDTPIQVALRMVDADGQELLAARSEARLSAAPGRLRASAPMVFGFQRLRLESEGTYEFQVLVEGQILATVELEARLLTSSDQQRVDDRADPDDEDAPSSETGSRSADGDE